MEPAKLIYSDRLHCLFAVWGVEQRDRPQRSKSEFSEMIWSGWWLYEYIVKTKFIKLYTSCLQCFIVQKQHLKKDSKNYFAEDKMTIIGKSIYWWINKKQILNKHQQQLKLIWQAIFLSDIREHLLVLQPFFSPNVCLAELCKA